jgi:15-cis-phytoene synthase
MTHPATRLPGYALGVSLARDKVAQADRFDYYSALFAPTHLRDDLLVLYAFWHEVSEIVDECREIQVARLKLTWWQEEVERLYQGQARHPIASALAPVVERRRLPKTAFLELIDGFVDRVGVSQYVTHEAWRDQARRTRGRLALLVGRLCDEHDAATAYTFIEWGACQGIACRIQRLGAGLRRGIIDIPEEDMQRHAVSKEDFYDRREDRAFRDLMKFEMGRVLDGLAQAERRIALQTHADLAPLYIGNSLWRALLTEIENDGCRVLSRRLELTPLRQWWTAWRAARRAKR